GPAVGPQHGPQTTGQAGQHSSHAVAHAGHGDAQHAAFAADTFDVLSTQHAFFDPVAPAVTASAAPQHNSHTSQHGSHPVGHPGHGLVQHGGRSAVGPLQHAFRASGQPPSHFWPNRSVWAYSPYPAPPAKAPRIANILNMS